MWQALPDLWHNAAASRHTILILTLPAIGPFVPQ